MPETRRYSAVCALHTFWLAARVRGLGVGWVSILDPDRLADGLEVPRTWPSSPTCASAGRRRSI